MALRFDVKGPRGVELISISWCVFTLLCGLPLRVMSGLGKLIGGTPLLPSLEVLKSGTVINATWTLALRGPLPMTPAGP